MTKDAKEELGKLDQSCQQQIDTKDICLEELRNRLQDTIEENKATIEAIKSETEEEYQQLDQKFKALITYYTDLELRAQSECTIQRQKIQDKQREYQNKREEEQAKQRVFDKLVKQTEEIQENIKKLRFQTGILDNEIKQKEQEICDLKKETQELDLFKFVLDYKIKDLKREVEPRAAEIEEMKKQTLNIDKKLKDLNLVNNMLILFVDQLDEDQSKMQEKSIRKRQEIMHQNSQKKNIKTDIYTLVQKIQVNPSPLTFSVRGRAQGRHPPHVPQVRQEETCSAEG
jgi:chromosome segregation ATPase